MSKKLWDFLMRGGGSNTAIFRQYPLTDLPYGFRLFCALIRGDAEVAEKLMKLPQRLWLHGFFGLLKDNTLASLSSSLLYRFKLGEAAANLPVLKNSDSNAITEGLWYEESLLVNLQRMSGIELSRFDAFDDQFVKLLDVLEPLSSRLVWPKGVSLARSLYKEVGEPFYRYSGDFDCIMRAQDAAEFGDLCEQLQYSPLIGDPGFCNQLEIGPTSSFEQLFASPSPSMVPSAVIGLTREGWPLIDPKFNPLDRGLKMIEADRFFADALTVQWRDRAFLAPSLIDHLLLSLVHCEKDRFHGWKSLLDIHFLANQINDKGGWNEFVRRCRLEGTTLSAWSGLYLSVDRFNSSVPADVIAALKPRFSKLSVYFSFTMEPLFYWNCSSLPALILNALFTADSKRKLSSLREAILPSAGFISQYYANDTGINFYQKIFFTILHLTILILPAMVVRRTFGRFTWNASQQYKKLSPTTKIG